MRSFRAKLMHLPNLHTTPDKHLTKIRKTFLHISDSFEALKLKQIS